MCVCVYVCFCNYSSTKLFGFGFGTGIIKTHTRDSTRTPLRVLFLKPKSGPIVSWVSYPRVKVLLPSPL